MRVVVLGTSTLTLHCAEAWRQNHDLVGVVSMPRESRPDNSADLEPYAASIGAPYLEFADLSAAVSQLRALRPDILFSTWPKLLTREVIESAPLCIGSHWSELPANRGRHPLHWMIALGMTQGAISFFKMDDGVDTGDILLQVPFTLGADVRIGDALDLLNRAAVEGCRTLASEPLTPTKQDHSKANTWRKRAIDDTIIDFRMSRSAIDRLVRSFCLPFPGAKISYKGTLIPIDRTADVSLSVSNLEPGRILAKKPGSVIVKADDGAIEIFPRNPGDLDLLPNSGCIRPPTAYSNHGSPSA